MKKLTSYFLSIALQIIIGISTIDAQNLSSLIIGGNTELENASFIFFDSKKNFLVGGTENYQQASTTNAGGALLSYHKKNGTIIWQKLIARDANMPTTNNVNQFINCAAGLPANNGFFILLDSVLFTNGFPSGCAESYHLLLKLDTNGNRIWSKTIFKNYSSCNIAGKLIYSWDSTNLIISNTKEIIVLDTFGNIIQQRTFSNNYFGNICAVPNNGIIALQIIGGAKILKYNMLLDSIWNKPISYSPKSVVANSNGVLYVASVNYITNQHANAALEMYDSNGVIIASKQLQIQNKDIPSKIIMANDSIWIVGVCSTCINTDTNLECQSVQHSFLLNTTLQGVENYKIIITDTIIASHVDTPFTIIDSGFSFAAADIAIQNSDIFLLSNRNNIKMVPSFSSGVKIQNIANNMQVNVFRNSVVVSSNSISRNNNDFSTYPNPCSNTFFVDAEWIGANYELISMDGKLLVSDKLKKVNNISFLQKGVYIIKINYNNKRIVVQ